MANDMGCNSYRFSLAWSRIEPEEGQFDEEAIAHYGKVIDARLAAGVTPMVTLHHFHTPGLKRKDHSEKEENIAYFERFAEVVFKAYSDRVVYWCTHNECGPFATMGWGLGAFPPGKNSLKLVAQVLLNLMRSHSRVYHRLKSLPNGDKVQIGLVKNIFQFDPEHRWNPIQWLICNSLDEVYNESIIRAAKTGYSRSISPESSSSKRICLSSKAQQFYWARCIPICLSLRRAQPLQARQAAASNPNRLSVCLLPRRFYRALKRINVLNKPVIITETDPRRQGRSPRGLDQTYIYAMRMAMSEELGVKGFHYWSLLDNFEWAEGYTMRFGLYEVTGTQERKLRDSAALYKKIIEETTNPIK